ncbi:hypothetical protein HPB48_006982 [Haemaphysalis longicornis]|uniref:Integrator complex subunit 5 n=1 Tax=Haemaphysalis longicornis TaxID=44386 RepID=A0A9J6FLI1_HAELO|nr:hypothetical protein HPB48_006982 [Haemaphysalis longicornis]
MAASAMHSESNSAAPDATLNDLRLFLAGTSSYESKIRSSDVAQAAIRLLKTLPVAREAVLEYMHSLFDDAVSRHIARLDSEEPGGAEERESAVEEVQRVLSGFIEANVGAWAPIVSSWSLELLGQLTRKYADRRMHYSSSLPEALQLWMACPATRALVELSTQCLSALIDSSPEQCVDALLETSVQHSPHFDWVVAHIGSCFPDTVIRRVLACGLRDFIGEDEPEVGAERKVPKLASVVGILGHLVGQHAADIRRALVALMQESFAQANPTREQLATIPFLLQLASMSDHLLAAVVSEFTKVLSADTLNKLSTLTAQWESAKIPGTRDLLSLTVVLIVQTGSADLRFLGQILDIAAGESEFSAQLVPAVPHAAGVLLDGVLLETQQRVFAGGGAEVPLLSALEARLGEVCGWLETRSGPRTMWLWNALALLCAHRPEKTALAVLARLLAGRALIYQVEVVHVNCLTHTISHLMAELRSGRVDSPTRLVENLRKLAAGGASSPVGVRVSETVCRFAEVLAEQMQRSPEPAYADAVAELLCTAVRPESLGPTALVRVASAAVAYLFAVVCSPHYGASRKHYVLITNFRAPIKVYRTLCTVNQHHTRANMRQQKKLSRKRTSMFNNNTKILKSSNRNVVLLCENQKFASSINFPQSHSSIVRVGVIGSGLRSEAPPPSLAEEEVALNRQLLLEALTACCALPWRNDRPAPGRTSPVPAMKIVALLLVEMVSSDVMFNGLPWPDEDFLKVTIERDLRIQATFEEHPHGAAADSPPPLLASTRAPAAGDVAGSAAAPGLDGLGDLLPLLSPPRGVLPARGRPALFCRPGAPRASSGATSARPAGGGDLRYMERLRAILINNIHVCGPLFQRFFSKRQSGQNCPRGVTSQFCLVL